MSKLHPSHEAEVFATIPAAYELSFGLVVLVGELAGINRGCDPARQPLAPMTGV